MSPLEYVTFCLRENMSASWITITVITFVVIPTLHFYVSRTSFNRALRSGGGVPPVVPNELPFIAHTSTFALGGNRLASAFL
jgi:hypothetical protein